MGFRKSEDLLVKHLLDCLVGHKLQNQNQTFSIGDDDEEDEMESLQKKKFWGSGVYKEIGHNLK